MMMRGPEDITNMKDGWRERSDPVASDMARVSVCFRYSWALKRIRLLERATGKRVRNVLDVGCSVGYGCKIMRDGGLDAEGMDVNPGVVRIAKKRYPGVRFRVGDALGVNEYHDVITAFEVIEHIKDWRRALNVWKKHCRLLLMSTPNLKYLKNENPHHFKEFTYEEAKGMSPKVWGMCLSPITTKPITALFGGEAAARFRLAAGKPFPRLSRHFLIEVDGERE